MDENFVKKAWYKTAGGIAFLTVLAFILLIVLTFAGFFVYYSIKLKFGDAGQLVKEFSFTPTAEQTTGSILEKFSRVEKPAQYIRQSNPVLGSEKAKITIIEFVDFECSYSREAYATMKSVAQKYNSVVRLVFKHLPAEQLHPDAGVAASAATCAQAQGKFWEYHDRLFETRQLDSASLLNDAKILGLNTSQFNLCLTENKFEKEITQDMFDATQLGLEGTPTYIVNGYKIPGSLNSEQWDKIILELLQKT